MRNFYSYLENREIDPKIAQIAQLIEELEIDDPVALFLETAKNLLATKMAMTM